MQIEATHFQHIALVFPLNFLGIVLRTNYQPSASNDLVDKKNAWFDPSNVSRINSSPNVAIHELLLKLIKI